jgi:hypothetical protein
MEEVWQLESSRWMSLSTTPHAQMTMDMEVRMEFENEELTACELRRE